MKPSNQQRKKKISSTAMYPYIFSAITSRYCELTYEDGHYPVLYFLITSDEDILGLTDDPSEGDHYHCSAASEGDITFITEFQKHWPDANPRFWELQLYRNYVKAGFELYKIRRDHEEESTLQRIGKIKAIMSSY